MNDIIIGDKTSSSCSAVVYYEHPEVQNIISHNSKLYWCHEEFTKTSIFILKDTDDGKALTDLLISKNSVEDIEDFLLDIALNNMCVSDFRSLMLDLQEESFKSGIRHNQNELRKVIGL